MTAHQKQHDKEFKMDAIRYMEEHPELTKAECARNLGIGLSTLTHWKHQYRLNNGDIPVRGSGNYQSDELKEIAHLKRELRNAQDALDILKKLSAFWEKIDCYCLLRAVRQDGGVHGARAPRLHLRSAEIFRRLPFRIYFIFASPAFTYRKAPQQGQGGNPDDL